jgi:hypothetical protein
MSLIMCCPFIGTCPTGSNQACLLVKNVTTFEPACVCSGCLNQATGAKVPFGKCTSNAPPYNQSACLSSDCMVDACLKKKDLCIGYCALFGQQCQFDATNTTCGCAYGNCPFGFGSILPVRQ